MEIATGAISTLLPKLGGLIKEEYNLQKSVRGEIMFLEAELEAMETALVTIASAPIDKPPNAQDKLWAREVRELSYDLEDNIDRFLLRVDHASDQLGLGGFIDRSLNLLTKAKIRHKIGTNIKKIRTQIREVSERRDRYKIDSVTAKPTCPSVDSLRQSALHKMATELIGTEEKANDLVKMLTEDDEPATTQLKVVSIVGIGGLGKTTLANVVYQKLKGQFDCGAFISVSLHPNMDQNFKSILHQIDRDRYKNINGETWNETQLIIELRGLLSNKRYFIVVDDIWNTSVWEKIMGALNQSACGSRIITTTRNLDVAQQTGTVYKLKPLSPVDSRKLFYLRIFGTEDKTLTKELAKKESENILRKCGGVPLAIATIGSMLASKRETEITCEYWSKVSNSMGSGLENSSDMYNMRSILSVSYHDLPQHLRTCLLYLSLYPEDYWISTRDFILKWIGEGFILKEQEDMFEIGEDYIHELINRSMIQQSPTYEDSKKPTRFHIHDMVLDLITFLSNEQHFLTILGAQQPESLPNRVRRLSLQTNSEKDDKKLEKEKFSQLRSLIVFNGAFNLLSELSRFPFLRVLDLTRAQVGNNHFQDICNLFHLRYLALHSKTITEIPKDIGNLKLLQVLDISRTQIVELPQSFLQLHQLAYLQFGTLVNIPHHFADLKSLKELIGCIQLKSPTTLQVLAGLTELRRVGLSFEEWDESYENPFLSLLSSMGCLKYLTITGRVNIDLCSQDNNLSPSPQKLQAVHIHGAICSVVPRWISTLCYLSILKISLLKLGEKDLQILGSIPYLSHLAITVKELTKVIEEELLVIGNVYPFQCLAQFEIYDNMVVMFAHGAMQKLQTLRFPVFETTTPISTLGFGLENLPSLEHVNVDMILSQANPEEVEAAEASIQKAVYMNPNMPTLKIQKRIGFVLNTQREESVPKKAMKIAAAISGVESVTLFGKQDMLLVCGLVNPTTILEKLKKAGILAELCDVRAALSTAGITPMLWNL